MLAWKSLHRSVSRGAAVCLVAAVLAGCSANRSVFESTPFRQARVEVIDTVEREAVWSMDVPVNQKLVVDLEHKGGSEREGLSTSEDTPDMLKWWLYPGDASQKLAAGYYHGSPLDQGEFDIQSQAIMLRYSIIPREDEVPTAEPPASSPPAPRPVEPPRDTDRDMDRDTDSEAAEDAADESGPANEPMEMRYAEEMEASQAEPVEDASSDEPEMNK